MAKLISGTYGEALYEVALEKNKASELLQEIETVRAIIAENPDFGAFMMHPGISKQDKLTSVETIFRGRVSDELTGFLMIVVEKERFKELDSIFCYFIDRVKADEGIGVAYVTTPIALTEKARAEVEAKLLETTEFKTMEMHYETDETLIGGMTIRIGDRVVDSSVRSKLDGLTKELLQIQLG